MQENLHLFRNVLLNAEQFPWNASLYLPKGEKWNLSSSCAVLTPDPNREDIDEEPELAEINNLCYALHFSSIQDIVSNAKQQLPNADARKIFKAFQFYFENDAFIDFLKEVS